MDVVKELLAEISSEEGEELCIVTYTNIII